MTRQRLIEEMRERTGRLLALLDRIEAGESVAPLDGLYKSGDVETVAKLLRKNFTRQHERGARA